MFEDENFKNPKKEGKQVTIADAQRLFRSLLSDQATDLYYSFCQDEICSSDNDWHCSICKSCMDWRVWHCDSCNRCMYFD